MNRKSLLALLFAVSLVATMALIWFVTSRSQHSAESMDGTAALGADAEADARPTRRTPREATMRTPEEQDDLEQKLVLMLSQMYGDRISTTGTQIMMAQIRTQMMTLFPGDWQRRFPEVLEAAFPGYAKQILATLRNVDAFDTWYAAEEARLAALSPEEREKALLEKKTELFGVEAVEELEAAARDVEKRGEALQETIRSLEASTDTTLDEKLDVYMDSMKQNLGDGPSALTLENGGLLSQAFFGLESVSRQLGELDPEARQQKINEIRRHFGYDEGQIAEMEADDRANEARWQAGYAYMKERRALEQSFSGEHLEQQIDALRKRYFGEEALTIQREEENDRFFRFERPRLYGRN